MRIFAILALCVAATSAWSDMDSNSMSMGDVWDMFMEKMMEHKGSQQMEQPSGYDVIREKVANAIGEAGCASRTLSNEICAAEGTALGMKNQLARQECTQTDAMERFFCNLRTLHWLDCNNVRDIATITADIDNSVIGQSLTGAIDECTSLAQKLTCGGSSMSRSFSFGDTMSATADGPSKSDLKNFAFFTCLKTKFDKACDKRSQDILSFFAPVDPSIWVEPYSTNNIVPSLVPFTPHPAYVYFHKQDIRLTPGTIVTTDLIMDTPSVYFDADPDALYTLIDEDLDIQGYPTKFFHRLVHNIKGSDLMGSGDVQLDWMPAFNFMFDGTNLVTPGNTPEVPMLNRHIILVYRQSAPIQVTTVVDDCSKYDLTGRFHDFQTFVDDNDLIGPMASNFYIVEYTEASYEVMCGINTCTPNALPFAVPNCPADDARQP